MNINSFLVSFCNNKLNDGRQGLIGRVNYNSDNQALTYTPIDLLLPKELKPKGVTGLCQHNGQYVALLQNKVPHLLFFNSAFELINKWPLEHMKGVHSILSKNNEIYFAVTGHDNIQKTADGVNFDVVWETGKKQDTLHLNSICNHQGKIYFTAFGEKSDQSLWSSAKSGVACAVDTDKPLKQNIWHPHSLFSHHGELYFCHSSLQKIESCKNVIAQDLPGYSRGLYVSDELVVCGTSKGRLTSHSTGVQISNISDKGIMAGDCGVWLYDNKHKTSHYLNLNHIATEVFDGLPL